jgi:LacI family transcriptional regulator
MVVPELGNPFFTAVAEGFETVADNYDVTLVLTGSAGRRDKQNVHLQRLQALRVQGILLTPIELVDEQVIDLSRHGTPMAILGRHPVGDAFCSVYGDDEQGGYLAARHLLDSGHTRLAFVGADRFTDRAAGARRALTENNRQHPPLLEVPTAGHQDIEAGVRAAADVLDRPSQVPQPTGFLCGNDLLALGVLQQMTHRHIRVPEEVAIVGYDDINLAAGAAVPLTSIKQPCHQMGRAAAELLFAEINETTADHQHRDVVFQPELVIRRSTQPRP